MPEGHAAPELRRLDELTLERRAQGRPDPLTVEVRFLTEGPYVYPELPVLGVRLLHTEGESEWFEIQDGGDYRSGRLARWDLLLTAEDGQPHEGVDEWQSFMGGGMSMRTTAKPGFVWGYQDMASYFDRADVEAEPEPVPLPLSSYRKPTELGRYSVRAVYSDDQTIADMEAFDHHTVFTSEPLEFEWVARRVPAVAARDERIDRAIEDLLALPETVVTGFSLEFYEGDASDDAHPLERLFAAGYASVPALLAYAQGENDPGIRARLCGALMSLTGVRPSQVSVTSIIGSHRFTGSPMPPGSGVMSSAPKGRATGKISMDAQSRYLAQIHDFLAGIEFEPR